MPPRSLILEAPSAASVQQQPAPHELGRLWPYVSRLCGLSSMICCVHAVVRLGQHAHGARIFRYIKRNTHKPKDGGPERILARHTGRSVVDGDSGRGSKSHHAREWTKAHVWGSLMVLLDHWAAQERCPGASRATRTPRVEGSSQSNQPRRMGTAWPCDTPPGRGEAEGEGGGLRMCCSSIGHVP